MNLKICCIKLSLATRVIAMVGLITSVLVLTQLFTELAEKDGNGTVSILLGLDVDEFTQFNSQSTQGSEIMIAFLFFSLIYAVASAILIWGSIVEISWYAFPWLACETLSFGTQIATITIHAINFQKKRNDRWIILLSIFNLFLSVYFWVVVFSAQRSWASERKQERENASTSTLSSGNETMPDDVFETTAPPLPQKCIEV
ncbi:uncharacterized protein [Rhodnius prolixus]|uniref:uncharacterized protein n=1 Tax=Rhodnius prolixus TaxID=13249 RepID=UPI003D18D904